MDINRADPLDFKLAIVISFVEDMILPLMGFSPRKPRHFNGSG